MSNVLKIKSRTTGAAGAPGSLAQAELAFNEQDNTLYIGYSGSGVTDATRVKNAIAGKGAFVDLGSTQTVTGAKTMNSSSNVFTGNGAALTNLTASNLTSGVVPNAQLPEADTSTAGIIETATSAEINAGSATDRAITPAGLAGSTVVTGKRLDELAAPTSSVSMGGQKLTNGATPTASTDFVIKSYVDAVQTGLDVKESVRVASTAAIQNFPDPSSAPTIDGVTLQDQDRVLVKNESGTLAKNNGIWVWNNSGSIFSRATDADNSPAGEVTSGMFTFVEEGTVNANSGFVLSTTGSITLGTTSLAFSQFSGAGQITAGNGLQKTGDTLSLDLKLQGGLEIDSGELRIDLSDADIGASGDLAVANGGTGVSTLTADGVLYGNGTSAIQATAEGANNAILYSNNGTPAFTTAPTGLTIDCGNF
jgi:hypothetical protein